MPSARILDCGYYFEKETGGRGDKERLNFGCRIYDFGFKTIYNLSVPATRNPQSETRNPQSSVIQYQPG